MTYPATKRSPKHPAVAQTAARRIRWVRACALLCLAGAGLSGAQGPDSVSAPAVPARAWAVDGSNNEVLVIQHPNSYLRYRFHEVNEKGDQVRDQIETPQGSVARLVLRDGKPLSAEEDAAECGRLNDMLANPDGFLRHIRREQDNKKLGIDLLKMMPDAMLWSYAPNQPQLPGREGAAPLVVLDFVPNPKWTPPTIAAEPLTGLQGRVWMDPASHRMVRLEGTIFHPVNIGWGMVAHIYPGGTVTLEQSNAGGDRWIASHVVEQLTLRALMVKTVKQRLVYDTSGYQAVPAMTFQQAIKVLLDTPLPGR
jgi:hypothetical protein